MRAPDGDFSFRDPRTRAPVPHARSRRPLGARSSRPSPPLSARREELVPAPPRAKGRSRPSRLPVCGPPIKFIAEPAPPFRSSSFRHAQAQAQAVARGQRTRGPPGEDRAGSPPTCVTRRFPGRRPPPTSTSTRALRRRSSGPRWWTPTTLTRSLPRLAPRRTRVIPPSEISTPAPSRPPPTSPPRPRSRRASSPRSESANLDEPFRPTSPPNIKKERSDDGSDRR